MTTKLKLKEYQLKKFSLLENGNVDTTPYALEWHTRDGETMKKLLDAGVLVHVDVRVVGETYWAGLYDAILNTGSDPVLIKKGYNTTRCGRCDDLVIDPGHVLLRVSRGSGSSFSDYLTGKPV